VNLRLRLCLCLFFLFMATFLTGAFAYLGNIGAFSTGMMAIGGWAYAALGEFEKGGDHD